MSLSQRRVGIVFRTLQYLVHITSHFNMSDSALLLPLLLLLAAASSAVPSYFLAREGAWPCLSAAEMAPCTCYADNDLNLFVDCQNLASLSILADLFNKPFQFKKFFRLKVSNSKFDGATLSSEVFKDFTFREVIMFDNNLSEVLSDTFSGSINDLTIFEFSDPGTIFTPATMGNFGRLRELAVAATCPSDVKLSSSSLVSVTIRCSSDVSLPNAIINMPALTTLHLRKSHLTEVGSGNFIESPLLQTLTLNENNIITFPSDALLFTSLSELDLSENDLSDMPTITGMKNGGVVRIEYNPNLKQLSQATTQPLLDNAVKIVATGVSLACDCDLRWLLGEDDDTMLLNNNIAVDVDCLEGGNYQTIREILTNFC